MKNPRVFISHASDDNDSFVISFAKRLLEQGVDAWVDKWKCCLETPSLIKFLKKD